MNLKSEITKRLSNIIEHIYLNPLIFVSETDIHVLVMTELMKIKGLGPDDLYPTKCSIGKNQYGKLSTEVYKSMLVHKEYGHSNLDYARSDIVIFNEKEINKIKNPLDLKAGDEKWAYLKPDYISEFGTEKAAGDVSVFRDHLRQDVIKVTNANKIGYVIHIHRNFVQSTGGKLILNRKKYKDYKKVLTSEISHIKTKKIKVLAVLVEIGNQGRAIKKEGKIKLFKNDEFIGIPQKEIKMEIEKILS